MKKSVVLIGNPVAGKGASGKIEKAAAIIEGRGFEVDLMLTGKKSDAEAFARDVVNSKLKTPNSKLLVVAAGGDGTYNEVANGLVYSDIPMAILPIGTTSVLARELNVPVNLEKAVDVALNGTAISINLGKITLGTKGGKQTARHFLLMAGIGFDGQIVFGVSGKAKKLAGKGAYIWSGFRTLLGYNPELITVKDISGSFGKDCYAAIVGNGSFYGGNFRVTPDSRLTDPYFHVFMTHGKGRCDLLRYVSGVITGDHLKMKKISYLRTAGIEVNGNAHIQIDGDYLGVTPARIEMAQNALRVVTDI